MKAVNWILHGISLLLIGLVWWLGQAQSTEKKEAQPGTLSLKDGESLSYAYINSDTLTASYLYIKDRGKKLAEKEARLQKQLEQKVQKLEQRFMQLQEKASIMTQSELEQAQLEIQQKELEINDLRKKLSQELDQDRIAMQQELYDKVEVVLKDIAAANNYQTIFSYTQGGQVLYIDSGLDITNRVLEKLNAQYEEENKSKK
ncbi:MAG: OmpH family outer membrane protein [Luteibaculum sp.]